MEEEIQKLESLPVERFVPAYNRQHFQYCVENLRSSERVTKCLSSAAYGVDPNAPRDPRSRTTLGERTCRTRSELLATRKSQDYQRNIRVFGSSSFGFGGKFNCKKISLNKDIELMNNPGLRARRELQNVHAAAAKMLQYQNGHMYTTTGQPPSSGRERLFAESRGASPSLANH